MAGNKCRVWVLIAFAVAGCSDADPRQLVWMPWDHITGPFRPEVAQPARAAPPRDRLRVVTYDTRSGFPPDRLAPALLANPELAAAEVLLLQEVERMSRDADSDAASLAAALGMGHVYATTTELVPHGTRGLAILSRFPMRDIEVMAPVEPSSPSDPIHAELAIAAVIDTTNGPLRIVNVHLAAAQNVSERIVEVRPIVLDAPSPIVVGGDFNTNDDLWGMVPLPLDAVIDTSQAYIFDGYMRTIGYDTPTAAVGPTWRGDLEDQRLDAIYTRGVATANAAVVHGLRESDHFPVRLDIHMTSP